MKEKEDGIELTKKKFENAAMKPSSAHADLKSSRTSKLGQYVTGFLCKPDDSCRD